MPYRPRLHPVDLNVGARIRLRRNFLGLSQVQLGQRLGASAQQVQKYETGPIGSAPRCYTPWPAICAPDRTGFSRVCPPNDVVEALGEDNAQMTRAVQALTASEDGRPWPS